MKILVINTVPTDKNGITNVIFNYMKVIDHAVCKFDMVMINNAEESYIKRVEEFGGKAHVVIRSASRFLSYIGKLSNIIKKNNYDIVHIHGNSSTMVVELFAAWIGGCKVRIVHSHNTTCYHPWIHKLLMPFFKALYTHKFACGEEAGDWLFGKENGFYILNNGVDTIRYAFNQNTRLMIRSRLNIAKEETLIGHVGHFDGKVKNQEFIIEVFKQILKKNSTYKLCLIGDGTERGFIQQKVNEYDLTDKVIFTGNINNVNEYLNAIDLIIMPSLHEGLPLSLIEQQANGLQCVCSDNITIEADKTGNLKFMSLQRPTNEWATEIISFININNRNLRSQKAIEDIKKAAYSIHGEAEKLVDIYSSCIS